VYALAAGAVAGLIAFRGLRMRPAAIAVGLGGVVLVAGLALGPLHIRKRPWNARLFHDRLTGRIVSQSGVTRAIVSMAGEGRGLQRVLVRADLLLAPRRIDRTALQLE